MRREDRVIIRIIIRLTVATRFLKRRFIPSRKKVEEGRICTMYSFSSPVAGINEFRSTCMVNFLSTVFPPYSRLMRGSTTLYRMSLTRFITTIRTARTIVVPMTMG